MKYSSIPLAQTVIEHCKAKGIKNIVISPGSRNAPLIISFTENPYFKCFSIVDERAAAFFALGIAQQLREPVAVVCTSGSALLNYYPAIAEAFYSDIPLVVLSADRPGYKIDVGDGQTIRQDNVFDRHIGYSTNLKQDITHATDRIERYAPDMISKDGVVATQERVQQYNDSQLNIALNTTLNTGLPVHINIPFEEPLYNTHSSATVSPIIKPQELKNNKDLEELENFTNIWNTSTKKMVLVGVNSPNTISQEYLEILANDPSVIVFTETTSNLHHPHFFNSIDSIIAPIEKSEKKETLFSNLQPDILLTFGGLIVSKKIKVFLRQYQPKHHYHIDEVKAYDTFFSLTHHFKWNVNSFLKLFFKRNVNSKSEYFNYWYAVKKQYEEKKDAYLAEISFSDMLAFEIICKNIPQKIQLQLSNSSTVRYVQLFNLKPSVRVFCNRGTSGIDGSTSTAIGASFYDENPTLFITGDISFFYDSNGLWNNYIRPDFRVIVINNQGGGIFRILPGQEKTSNFETYFETIQDRDISHLCALNNIEYQVADNSDSLTHVLKDFFLKSARPKLLEIKTPRIKNDKILLGYFDFIS